nr:MAG TPA: Structural protein [Bacteriophage sp.]
MTYREVVYMILDSLKLSSDDSYLTEEHVLFLASKMRSAILKQTYSNVKKEIPESNYQDICLDLIEVPAIAGEPCEGGTYLRSKQKIPTILPIGNTKIYPLDYYQGEITYVSRERMRYVGYNKWLQNIIYASLGPDQYLYFKSSNPQYIYMQRVGMNGIFEDAEAAAKLQ